VFVRKVITCWNLFCGSSSGDYLLELVLWKF